MHGSGHKILLHMGKTDSVVDKQNTCTQVHNDLFCKHAGYSKPVFFIGGKSQRRTHTQNRKAAKLGFFLGDMYSILLPGEPAKDSPRLKAKVRDTDTGTREKTRIRRQKPGEKGKGARKL